MEVKMNDESQYGVNNKEPLSEFRGHTPAPQFYGYCALCGEPINRAAKTQGRAPTICSSPECKKERDRLKKQASRRGKAFQMEPLGGRGDLRWLASGAETVGQEGWQTHGRQSKQFSFNTRDNYSAFTQRLGNDYWAAEADWEAIEAERMLRTPHEPEMSPKPPIGERGNSNFWQKHALDEIRKESQMAENLSVVVAAVHKETNQIEDVVLPVSGIRINSEDKITECIAKLGESNFVNVVNTAWRYLIVDDRWSDEFTLDLLTRWHGSIQAELDGVTYLGALGNSYSDLRKTSDGTKSGK
jgi:hypothetical protein